MCTSFFAAIKNQFRVELCIKFVYSLTMINLQFIFNLEHFYRSHKLFPQILLFPIWTLSSFQSGPNTISDYHILDVLARRRNKKNMHEIAKMEPLYGHGILKICNFTRQWIPGYVLWNSLRLKKSDIFFKIDMVYPTN